MKLVLHLYALSGLKEDSGPRSASGKPVVALCGAPEKIRVHPKDAESATCDRCLLLWGVARANIGDDALSRAPFQHGGTPSLAALFFVHRILDTEPGHTTWTRWTMSPAFGHLKRGIVAGGFVGNPSCFMCGCPYSTPMAQNFPCHVCGARRKRSEPQGRRRW